MRFAYIDSNGNEVPIPSVDALALRIELGAIDAETELYDAQADQWGPAHTHEIFHTLSRAAEEGEQAFVAPLPPVPAPASEEPAPESAPEEDPPEEEPEPPVPATAAPESPSAEEDLGLTLAAAATEEEADGEPDADEASGMADIGLGADVEDGAAFDFGDLDGGLEVEGSSPDAGSDSPMDFGMADAAAGGFGDVLEQPLEFSSEGIVADPSATLDLERPMSDFSPEAPPAWMESEGAADSGGDVMDFSSLSADVAAPDDVAGDPRGRRAPKDKPSPPKFKRRRSLVAPIVTAVVLAAIGVGGYVAWPMVSAWIASRGLPVEVEVALPPIPEALLPQMTAAADAAFVIAFSEARAEVDGGLARPPENWLAGRYFANASEYGAVETFWADVQDQLASVRRIDAADFHGAYERAMAAEGVEAEHRPVMLERADAGFAATARPRAEVFDLVDDLVGSALGLHNFLVANEDNIEYAPAASITSDPVLEARPATPEIGEAMRDRIDRVTGALDALDYLDTVTAEGLWAAVLTRVQQVGFR